MTQVFLVFAQNVCFKFVVIQEVTSVTKCVYYFAVSHAIVLVGVFDNENFSIRVVVKAVEMVCFFAD